MSLHILPDLEQGSPEWHDQRRGIVTASVVGRLISVGSPDALTVACPSCGVETGPCISAARKTPTPIKTIHTERTAAASDLPPVYKPATGDDARNLTALLAAERITGYTEPTYMNDDMMRGQFDEPFAIEKYAEHYAPVHKVGFMVRDEPGWTLGYSPDGLVGDDGAVEVKSRRQKKQLTTVLSDAVPPENMAQLQCGLLVSGRKWIDYISYSGGMALWRKRVYPDPAWHDALIAAAIAFEANATDMVDRYLAATADLPMTERANDDLGLVF